MRRDLKIFLVQETMISLLKLAKDQSLAFNLDFPQNIKILQDPDSMKHKHFEVVMVGLLVVNRQ